jgi:hypothetical protein
LFVSGCCTAKHHTEGCLTVVLDDLEILYFVLPAQNASSAAGLSWNGDSS